MSELPYCYGAYGLRIRSALALPFFDPLPDAQAADVSVRLGAVPRTLPGVDRPVRNGMWQARPGAFLLQMEGVARYLIADGREVRIEPLGGDHADIASLLAGLWTVLLQQRGVVPLHAAAVRTTAGAVLLIGRSGDGKSSLAATLIERGHALLADDVSGLALRGGRVTALPSFTGVRLWKQTLQQMRTPLKVRSRVRPGVEKYWVEASSACAQGLPVRAAVVLTPSHHADIRLSPVSPSEAFTLLCERTHRQRVLRAMGQRLAHFRVVAAMARQVPMLRAWRPRHSFLLEELADHVEARVAELGATSAGASAVPRYEPPAAVPPEPALSAPSIAKTTRTRAPGFVWIACWPKSGSTWLRTVLTNCLRDDGQPASINALAGTWLHDRDEFDDYLGFDSSHMTAEETERNLARFRAAAVEELLAAAGPMFAKTHEAYRLPDGPPRFPRGGKVVYLVRNPLDVAVSYARHFDQPVARIIQLMNSWQAHEGNDPDGVHDRLPEPMTTWSNHALSWIEQAELPVHVARYEDLLADPRAGFGAIARFAGLDLDDERLDRAVEHSAFHRLQAQEAEAGFKEKSSPARLRFFRAGTAGQWRSELAPEQVQAIVDVHGDIMARFGYLQEAQQFCAT